jgi:hypothetical protein
MRTETNSEIASADRPCTPVLPIRSRARVLTGFLAALMAVLGLVMSIGLRNYTFDHNFHHGINSPILAVELASNYSELASVLDPPPLPNQEGAQAQARAVVRTNTYEDCVFILLYTSFLWFFGMLFAFQRDGVSGGLRIFRVVIVATGFCDYAENLGIFRAISAGQLSDSLALNICWPSRCKWSLFGVALLITAFILLRSGSLIYSLATRRLLALAYIVSGALVIMGLWNPPLVELGINVFGFIVLINLVALLGPYISDWIPVTVPVYVDDFCERRKSATIDVAVTAKRSH